jgi:hypothetical protein
MELRFPVQFIKLTKNLGGETWIDPNRIIKMDIGTQRDHDAGRETAPVKGKDANKKPEPSVMTIIQLSGAKKDVFVRESPEEINKIIRTQTYHFEFAVKGK